MNHTVALGSALLLAFSIRTLAVADSFIVENGQPRAEIVIAANPLRTVRLAAADLQTYVQKISGARLPIVTEPSGRAVKLFVGRSAHTDKMGIKTDGLDFGAYRLVSGPDWMVFMGEDTEFTPPEPWARNNQGITNGKLQQDWETVSGVTSRVPNANLYKDLNKVPAGTGLPDGSPAPGKGEFLSFWAYDEHGSFNAVSGFLRRLGVRWLLPDELGEIIPTMKSIALPQMDETVRPDFELRQFNWHGPEEATLWGMRLGVRYRYGMNFAHGMSLLGTQKNFDAHPEWFAQYGGTRRFDLEKKDFHFCYSNPELFEETLRCVRAQFDVFDFEGVSVMPPDAYTSICQCPLCAGKDDPDLAPRGALSNHVWDFVNRVAKEIGKSHPGKLIYCCAYGQNLQPPTRIAKLEPNVQVVIVGARRPKSGVSRQDEGRALREGWRQKTDRPILNFENYPLTGRGWFLPCFMARTIGQGINETKGSFRGEQIWMSPFKEMDGTGFLNAFQYYFTARAYWGGPNLDIGAMLDEYCRLLYGQAGEGMKSFFDYCEIHWEDMETDGAKAETALQLFATAQTKVNPSSIEARRLALVDDFLAELRKKATMLGQKRGVVPKLRMAGEPKDIVIDGNLDEAFWKTINTGSRGTLDEVQTGRAPAFGTTVMAGWKGHDLYFAIRCDERRGERPNVTTTKNGDTALWLGDAVEILLQTDAHSYYQIAVNPAGALVDYDRAARKESWDTWDSKAEVATRIAEDHWVVELRLPVTDDGSDPLHQVVGREPDESLPWHFNVCRQRIRENGREFSAFSPTGKPGIHDVMRFAHLHTGKSHHFEADLTIKNFVTDFRAASALPQPEALAVLIALADDAKLSELQKSAALKEATSIACRLKDYAKADELTARIPIEAEKKVAAMSCLLAQRKATQLIEQFGAEDLTRWPFWAAGEAFATRGRAYADLGDEAKAAADFQAALEFTTDKKAREQIAKRREGRR